MELEDYNCPLCIGLIEESLVHLFFSCPFASLCWNWIQVHTSEQLDTFQNLELIKEQLRVPFFMEVILIMCWTIWKSRNDLIFSQVQPSLAQAKRFFKSEFALFLYRAKKSYFPFVSQWLNNLV